MSYESDMLKLLNSIKDNTGRSAGATARKLGEKNTSFSGKDKDNFSEGAFSGLADAIKKTIMVQKRANIDRAKLATEDSNIRKEFNKELEKAIKGIKEANVGDTFEKVAEQNKDQFEKLGKFGFNMSGIFDQVANNLKDKVNKGKKDQDSADDKASGTADIIADAMKQSIGSSTDLIKQIGDGATSMFRDVKEEAMRLDEEVADARKRMESVAMDRAYTGLVASIGSFVARVASPKSGSGALESLQSEGFQAGGVAGFNSLMLDSAMNFGSSMEETTKFVNDNRMILGAISKDSMKTANKGLESVVQYNEMLKDTFGAGNQLERLSKGLNILTNVGIDPTKKGIFSDFAQTVENMQFTMSKGEQELFSTLDDLSRDKGFQKLAAANEDQNIISSLAESFLLVRESAFLTADEFFDLNKRIAQQQNETAVNRVVQGAVGGNLARSLGFSEDDSALLEKSIRNFSSLGTQEEKDNAMALMAKVENAAGARLVEANKMDNAQGLAVATTIETMLGIVGPSLQSRNIAANRARANVGGNPEEAERLRESTDASNEADSTFITFLSEAGSVLSGIASSPLVGAAGFLAGMVGSVFLGTLQGNIAANLGKGGIKSLLGSLTSKLPKMFSGGAAAAASAASAASEASMSAASSALGGGMGSNASPSSAASKGGSALSKAGGLAKGAARFAGPLGLIVAAGMGINKGFESEKTGSTLGERTTEGVLISGMGFADAIVGSVGELAKLLGMDAPKWLTNPFETVSDSLSGKTLSQSMIKSIYETEKSRFSNAVVSSEQELSKMISVANTKIADIENDTTVKSEKEEEAQNANLKMLEGILTTSEAQLNELKKTENENVLGSKIGRPAAARHRRAN